MLHRRALFATSLLAAPGLARAQQSWPTRPVRIVVAYPPGGSTDVLARGLAAALQERFGQPFVVENRPGGAAVVGTQAVAQAAPDGYTLALGNNQTHAANAAMIRNLGYDPVADFTPVAHLATVHHALVVAANSPSRSMADLIARGRREQLTYASSGVGSASHVIAEAFVRRQNLRATHVPYRGGAQATTDTVAGTVDFFVSTWPQVVQLVRDGRLRGLAIGAPQRVADAPDVPTFAELEMPLLAVDAWFGLWGPARTPAEVVTQLGAACTFLLRQPAMVERLQSQGFTAAPMVPAAFAVFQREEVERWKALVELTGIRIES